MAQNASENLFYDRLKALCKQKNVSLRSLAQEIGTKPSTLGAWRDGASPNSSFVVRIADCFQVSCDYLLGRTDDPRMTDERTELSQEELHFLETLRACDEKTRQRAMLSALAAMGALPSQQEK